MEWALVCNRLLTSESGSSMAGWRSDGRDVMREGRMRGSVSSKEFWYQEEKKEGCDRTDFYLRSVHSKVKEMCMSVASKPMAHGRQRD